MDLQGKVAAPPEGQTRGPTHDTSVWPALADARTPTRGTRTARARTKGTAPYPKSNADPTMRMLVVDMATMDMAPTQRMEQDAGIPLQILIQKKESPTEQEVTLVMASTEASAHSDISMQQHDLGILTPTPHQANRATCH